MTAADAVPYVHVNQPPVGIVCRWIGPCPVCEKPRRTTVRFLGTYYGEQLRCLGCGDRWQDGQLAPRPFERGWRDKSRAAGRVEWRDALTPAEYRRRCREQIRIGL